jgi:hypothetical protein
LKTPEPKYQLVTFKNLAEKMKIAVNAGIKKAPIQPA